MRKLTVFLFLFVSAGILHGQTWKNMTFENSPIGFASVNILGLNGTTGGAGADTVQITDNATLVTDIATRVKTNKKPVVYVINGTITGSGQISCKNVNNITFIGKGTDALMDGVGIQICNATNIIVRNIRFRNCKPDCITVNTTSSSATHHVWIDHCTFSDDPEIDLSSSGTHDGLLDVTHRSSYVTISWCEFHNHDKVSLLGYTDNASDEVDQLRTTYHHNWWNNTVQRHPRVRHALCHVFDNYYDGSKTAATTIGMGTDLGVGYGITSTCEADVLVESNYFDKVYHPTEIGQGSSPAGDLVARYNFTNNGPVLTRSTHTTPFEASTFYSYTLDSAANVPSIVQAGAGAGKLGITTGITEKGLNTQPISFLLNQNFPNPFNPSTVINWQLPASGFVTLKVYNTIGKEVAALVSGYQAAGSYSSKFNAANLPSGLYFYTLKTANFSQTKKMLLLK